jgi:dihydrolipoamide dehydrogenase
VAIIGGGPGGYVCAIRAAQLAMKVALIEKREALGGTCLNIGCIPAKAMLESSEFYVRVREEAARHGIRTGQVELDLSAMLARKEEIVKKVTGGLGLLMRKQRIEVIRGTARPLGPGAVEIRGEDEVRRIEPGTIVLATGSEPVALPFLPFDGERVIDSTDALSLSEVPERLVVVGAGAIGLELGSLWARLGAKVTLIELLPQIAPFADAMMAKMLARALKAQGLEILVETRLTGAEIHDEEVTLHFERKGGKTGEITCDRVLVAVGRRPYTEGLQHEELGIAMDGPRVAVDERYATSVEGIYAIGDLIQGPMLAHKAQEEGVALAELLAGMAGHVNYAAIPSVIYTHPELAMVGLTEAQAREQGLEIQVGRFYFRAIARALTMESEFGLVKFVADAHTDRLLGVHILGPHASELIAEAVLALEFGASAEDLARTCHAHPTLSEIMKEGALAVDRRAIHG